MASGVGDNDLCESLPSWDIPRSVVASSAERG